MKINTKTISTDEQSLLEDKQYINDNEPLYILKNYTKEELNDYLIKVKENSEILRKIYSEGLLFVIMVIAMIMQNYTFLMKFQTISILFYL